MTPSNSKQCDRRLSHSDKVFNGAIALALSSFLVPSVPKGVTIQPFQEPGKPKAKQQGGANQNDIFGTFTVCHWDGMAQTLHSQGCPD